MARVGYCHYGIARVGFCHYGKARVGHCHYGMARVGHCHYGIVCRQFSDGGTASSMDGSYEYIGYGIADSLRGVDLQLGVWASC